ncbi:hypothetical protein OROGR_021652 [Orobanche gracilis]
MTSTSIIVGFNSSSAGLCKKPYPTRSQAALSAWNLTSRLSLSKWNDGVICFSGNKTIPVQSDNKNKRNSFAVYANSVPGAPSPFGPPMPLPVPAPGTVIWYQTLMWRLPIGVEHTSRGYPTPNRGCHVSVWSWIIGLVVTFVLPFLTNKWGALWELKNKVLGAVQTVEDIVEAVERVAEKVDEIAEEIGDDVPQGKLKDLVELVGHVAEKTAKTADCLDNVIDKVQEAEVQVEDMIVESIAKKKAKSSPVEDDKAQDQ